VFSWVFPPPAALSSFDTLDVFRVRDGRLTDHWGIADLLGVLMQLGRLSGDTAL
jgi:predicted SnoaL-like aldol condensation-catalyzing enzyme